ncbi:MAG: SHOCT domain-containing protein, partial [Pseudomonadota bacterium]
IALENHSIFPCRINPITHRLDPGVHAPRAQKQGENMEESIGFFDIIWSIFWLFLMVAWFWVMISVVSDIFRSKDLNGISKAIWIGAVMLLPWLGVLAYLVLRGDKMEEHNRAALEKMEGAQRDYIRSVANVSAADELERLATLKEKGVLSDEEFEAQKAKVLAV